MQFRPLTEREHTITRAVMGSYAFYGVVVDALMRRKPLSVIRVSDGEKKAMEYIEGRQGHEPLLCCDEGFRRAFGVEGITCGEIAKRLSWAVDRCTHFAPTLGHTNPAYDMLPYFHHWLPGAPTYERPQLVCEMFQYHWDWTRRKALMELAGKVLIINRDNNVFVHLESDLRANRPGAIQLRRISLDNWRESEDVLQEATEWNPRLTLMSAALGSKYIGPLLAERTNSVVLDIGQAANCWHNT